MTTQAVIYCIDASAFIDGWRRYYPPDVLPSLWSRIGDLAEEGRIKTPEEVRLELRRGADELFAWVGNYDQMFMLATEEIQTRVSGIVNSFPNFLPERSPDGVWADPYVIAVAQEHNGIVVTGEKPADANARHPKIPNICNALGIMCVSLLDLMRRENWRF
jgi:hypothetical protein